MQNLKYTIVGIILGIFILGGAVYSGSRTVAFIGNYMADETIYGGMFMMDNATSTTFTGSDVYTSVIGESSAGLLNGMTHASTNIMGTTTISYDGVYSVIAGVSSSGGNAKEYHYTIGINSVPQNATCHLPRKMGAGGDIGTIPTPCRFDLDAGDEITLMVENTTDTTALTISDFSMLIDWTGKPL